MDDNVSKFSNVVSIKSKQVNKNIKFENMKFLNRL